MCTWQVTFVLTALVAAVSRGRSGVEFSLFNFSKYITEVGQFHHKWLITRKHNTIRLVFAALCFGVWSSNESEILFQYKLLDELSVQ